MPPSRSATRSLILGVAAILALVAMVVLSRSGSGLLSASLIAVDERSTDGPRCDTTLVILPHLSHVDIAGTLNEKKIRCGHGTAPMFSGALNLALTARCPRSQAELVDSRFSFVAASDGATPLVPQDGIVLSAQGVRINAKEVQVVLETTRPIAVSEATFDDPKGLRMTITSGSVKVLGKVFDISGYSAIYGISGYFDYDGDTGLQLFVSPEAAVFDLQIDEPHIDGTVVITGAITAYENDVD